MVLTPIKMILPLDTPPCQVQYSSRKRQLSQVLLRLTSRAVLAVMLLVVVLSLVKTSTSSSFEKTSISLQKSAVETKNYGKGVELMERGADVREQMKELNDPVPHPPLNLGPQSRFLEISTMATTTGIFPRTPFNVQSGWMPKPGHSALIKFIKGILDLPEVPISGWAPCVQDMWVLLEDNEVLGYLVDQACKENWNVIASHTAKDTDISIPRIPSRYWLLNGFNALLNSAPVFIDDALVGLPFSGWVVGMDSTLTGSALFRLPQFNDVMGEILNVWNQFLDSWESNVGFRVEGQAWLSPKAKDSYQFPIWKKDNETLPYWNSWNSFFTRLFEDPGKSRPIGSPNSNKVVNSANDGSLYRWRDDLAKTDVFWFKDMTYSLSDIFSSPDPIQQAIIDDYNLVEMFEGGSIFQTYLNPYNFHRWWAPVNGKVLFDPLRISGFYFSKLVLPDYAGATTASLPYLAQVNARGIIVIETEDYGNVCCIPLGMSEISTISFNENMKKGAPVSKGDEMGMFNYGGSSFALIFQKIPGKKLVFMDSYGDLYEENPPAASSSSGSGGQQTLIGSQIGVWVDLGSR